MMIKQRKRNRKTRHQKRAERIQRVAPSLSVEEIMPLSEDAARALHQQRVREWFGGQNAPRGVPILNTVIHDLKAGVTMCKESAFSNAESRWL